MCLKQSGGAREWLAWCVGAVDHDEDPTLVAVKGKNNFQSRQWRPSSSPNRV